MSLKTLTIDRSKWKTGDHGNKTGEGYTCLLNKEGYQCCLGFFCEQSGIDREFIKGVRVPGKLIKNFPKVKIKIPLLRNNKNPFVEQAIQINDCSTTTAQEKEVLITELFKTKDVTVNFVGEY
jgi:hypothetical protein